MKPSWNSFRDPGGRLFVSEGREPGIASTSCREIYSQAMRTLWLSFE
jgi:hypothetical protein